MEVKIGVVYTPKELVVELDGESAEVAKTVEQALDAGASVLWLTDTKGRRVGVPTDKVAYVEIGSDESERRVGFGRP